MSERTTHSDLSRELLAIAAKLRALPEGLMVSDASSLRCITDAARILVEQDKQIATLVISLRSARECRYGGR